MNKEKCCTISCENPLDQNYWDTQYQCNSTGWDLGCVSPPIQTYIDSLSNKDISILIPGCGNSYEAEYLLKQGFSNVTLIDIAPTLIATLQQKFKNNLNITIILGDFFQHQAKYDLILEQTFFCALPPSMRQKYVWKMHHLLNKNGILAGVLFNKEFASGPPFGGTKKEYKLLFDRAFELVSFETARHSAIPRANTELAFQFRKNNEVVVTLYNINGITHNESKETVGQNLAKNKSVLNVSISNDFTTILVVSKTEIPVQLLQTAIGSNKHYEITKHEDDTIQ
ncbi:methyltransferase domain-containing protein [Flavobacterium faecale]|uniref:methyltransferase domain-containing protein n=1 Tax=Flavobacterium faecale TaxID=1355330 RepID=UPI003AAC9A4E